MTDIKQKALALLIRNLRYQVSEKMPLSYSDLLLLLDLANAQAAEIERLREALEAAPFIGRTESVNHFMERQNAWLKGPYLAAVQEQSK